MFRKGWGAGKYTAKVAFPISERCCFLGDMTIMLSWENDFRVPDQLLLCTDYLLNGQVNTGQVFSTPRKQEESLLNTARVFKTHPVLTLQSRNVTASNRTSSSIFKTS